MLKYEVGGMREITVLIRNLKIIYLKSIKKYLPIIILYMIFGIANLTVDILMPFKLGSTIDAAIGRNRHRVVFLLLQALLLFFMLAVISCIKNIINIRISTKMSEEIKNRIITKVMSLPMKEIDLLNSGQIMSKLEDVQRLTGFFMSVISSLFINILSVIITAVVIFKISPILALVHYINVPVLYFIFRKFGKVIKKKEKAASIGRDAVYNFLFGMLQGIREIKTLGGVNNVLSEYFFVHRDFINKEYEKGKASIVLGTSSTLFSGITQLVFLLVACIEIMNGSLSLGMYYAFNAYASRFTNTLSAFANMGTELSAVSVAAERVAEYCVENENKEIDEKAKVEKIQSIKVNNISFGYDRDVMVLRGIDLELCANSLYVIVGNNGCGKSTLLDLIMNFYKPFEGEVLFNNINVSQIDERCLFSKVAYIRQNPFFFNLSVIDNMKIIDKNMPEEKVREVCEIVGMNKVIERLPEGYRTVLGEDGCHFSGGQIHRLALARGLLTDAEVYILDEITADLDGENERIIMDILNGIARSGKLVIMVSHRLSTITKAGNILVMDNGKIIASGTHEQLIKKCGKYKSLCG